MSGSVKIVSDLEAEILLCVDREWVTVEQAYTLLTIAVNLNNYWPVSRFWFDLAVKNLIRNGHLLGKAGRIKKP